MGVVCVCPQDENAAFMFSYDEPLSHLIYAGADFICVPSMFEPCGLTQLIAMRYGTIPIVRKVRFCRYRFSPTGELKYRGARRVRTQVHCIKRPLLLDKDKDLLLNYIKGYPKIKSC